MWKNRIRPLLLRSESKVQDVQQLKANMGTLRQSGILEPLRKKGDKTACKMTKEGRWSGFIEKPKASGETDGAVCLIQHSPYRILKIAGKGDVAEFERLYMADPTRLHIQDQRGQGVLHHAANKGRLTVMDFALGHGADIDLRDFRGNTPLHTAVENTQGESIAYLLQNGADSAARNDKQFTPLILAIDLGLVAIVQCLLNTDSVNPESPGESGGSPLHHCALKDEPECAKILLSSGANINIRCSNLFYPIHTAAYNASTKTIEVFINHGQSDESSAAELLTLTDKEGNSPLHAAVTSGDLQAVRVCLQAGASVSAQQEEKLTPVHFAASQGALEILELMFEICPKGMAQAIERKDCLGMTPLHKAAIFNHENITRCLLDHGADINCEDSQLRTPLMTASAKCGWNTVRYLIQRGALIHRKDEQSRNFLHLAIRNGGRLHEFGYDLIINVKNLLNEKDDLGCTPLHYASKEGYLSAIEDLIGLGAMLNPKNNQRQSPFHFAARYGRYNTCLRLLDSEQGPNIINEADNTGLTALHIAAENGHTKILSLLLQRGAAVQKSFNGDSPLHLAAANAYTQSMRQLLGVHANLLDCKNKEGETALHLAALHGHVSAITLLLTLGARMERNVEKMTFFDFILDNRNSEAAMAVVTHDRWCEVMELTSTKYTCTMIGLIQQLPDVTIVVLDRCQTTSGHDRKESDFHIIYNFRHLHCPDEEPGEKKRPDGDCRMAAVTAMVKFGRVDCLSHPVCVNFLQMKWNGCGMWFHFIYLGLYLVFLGLLTNFAITHPRLCRDNMGVVAPPPENQSDVSTVSAIHMPETNQEQISMYSTVSLCILVSFSILNTIKDIYQILQQKGRYFADWSNAVDWGLHVTAFIYVIPFLLEISLRFQYEAGTLAVFLAWFNLLHYLQRFDFFGIYVVMFLAILSTLVQVLCVFSILIVAFGLAFYMLMGEEATKAYSTPGLSMLRTAMMMFELDYMESFSVPYTDDDPKSLHFDKLSLFMVVLFVLLMPILLMNLLIGLAVGDIEAVQRDARLKRLAMQVEHHADLERKLPTRIVKMVDKVEYKVYPNRGQQFLRSWLMKVTSSSDEGAGQEGRGGISSSQSNTCEEHSKVKQRLKEITNTLNKQHDLLRLIVQKMDISARVDYRDEGDSGNDVIESLRGRNFSSSKWKRNKASRQSAVVARWKQISKL